MLGLELVYGVPHLSESEVIAKMASLGPRDLQEACRRYLVEPFQVTSAVG
jgi:hypothetical protein